MDNKRKELNFNMIGWGRSVDMDHLHFGICWGISFVDFLC